jgi:hypothetical protein
MPPVAPASVFTRRLDFSPAASAKFAAIRPAIQSAANRPSTSAAIQYEAAGVESHRGRRRR